MNLEFLIFSYFKLNWCIIIGKKFLLVYKLFFFILYYVMIVENFKIDINFFLFIFVIKKEFVQIIVDFLKKFFDFKFIFKYFLLS